MSWKWTLGLLLFGFALRLIFFVGVGFDDDVLVVWAAHEMGQGKHVPSQVLPESDFAARYALTAPTALALRIFGINDAASTLMPMACSLAMILVAGLIGTELGGRATGLLASSLMAVLPIEVLYASQLNADGPAALFMALAFYAWLRSLRARDGRGERLWLVGAGLAILTGHLTKISCFFILAPLIWLACRRGRLNQFLLWCVGIFLAGVSIEGLIYLRSTGDFLYRFHIVSAGQHAANMEAAFPDAASTLRRIFLDLPLKMFNPLDADLLFFGILFPFAALCIRPRDPGGRGLVVWFAALFALMSLWPSRVWPYRPSFVVWPRTLAPLVLPSILIVSSRAAGWWTDGKRLRVGIAGAVVLVLSAVGNLLLHRHLTESKNLSHEAFQKCIEEGADVVLSDPILVQHDYIANPLTYWNRFAPRPRVASYTQERSRVPGRVFFILNTRTMEDFEEITGTVGIRFVEGRTVWEREFGEGGIRMLWGSPARRRYARHGERICVIRLGP